MAAKGERKRDEGNVTEGIYQSYEFLQVFRCGHHPLHSQEQGTPQNGTKVHGVLRNRDQGEL